MITIKPINTSNTKINSDTIKVTEVREKIVTRQELLNIKEHYESELIKLNNLIKEVSERIDLLNK